MQLQSYSSCDSVGITRHYLQRILTKNVYAASKLAFRFNLQFLYNRIENEFKWHHEEIDRSDRWVSCKTTGLASSKKVNVKGKKYGQGRVGLEGLFLTKRD